MMKRNVLAQAIAGLLLGAACWLPLAAPAQEGGEAAPAMTDPALEEERARVRKELEQREAERNQQRQAICEQARAEIQRIADVPPRSVMRTNEDGSTSRMTEEEHAAHLGTLRTAETENCQ